MIFSHKNAQNAQGYFLFFVTFVPHVAYNKRSPRLCAMILL